MPKTNIPNYRLHKASGQAFVELEGRRFYLGKYGSKASREEYELKISEYLANGRKLPPIRKKTRMSCHELAIHALEWANGYYMKNGVQTPTFNHFRNAISLFVANYGNESVDDFVPLSLVFLQNKWIDKGLARQTVNRYVGIIKQTFRFGTKFGWVDANTYLSLHGVDNLKAGRTQAHEYRKIGAVDAQTVEKTLPFLPPIVADMVRVQLLCGMRPQEVRNMRSIDIDRSKDIWKYVPSTHKTEHTGKVRFIPIGPKAQAILTSYLFEKEDMADAFLFSPQDTVMLQRFEKRQNRKIINKKGPVRSSQLKRSNPNPKKINDSYSKDAYTRAFTRACKKAGVPAWTPNQLRHTAGTEIRSRYSLDAAQAYLGHANAKTTEIYAGWILRKQRR
ncbi:MAG: tyrosine-type recombinase/integrase [Thermoguttaceae bacterium]